LPSLEEEEARLRGEISLLQTELRILDRDTKERPSPTGHAAADAILMYTGINKEMVDWKAQLDKVADKNTEIYEKNEELNDLLLKRKAILEDLSTLIDWGSFFGAGEEE